MKTNPSSSRRCRQKRKGFTLIETVASVTVLVLALSLGLGGVIFIQKNMMQQNTQTELDLDLRRATQRLQNEMRLSALHEMIFYPADAKIYTAVSFPISKVSSLTKTNNAIVWDTTVIYHVSSVGEENGLPISKLQRTVFENRNNELSTYERQLQLDQVVRDGDGKNATAEGETTTTGCLFEHVFNWEIIPLGSYYDGYSPQHALDSKAFLGSFNLEGGEHTIRFEVTGKDALSSGYRIGLDSLSFSHSQTILEAEDQAADGYPYPTVELDQGFFSNYRKLIFDATEPGQAFEITIYNDRWEDTLFDSIGADSTNNVTHGYDRDFSPPEITLRLEGSTTNQFAINQTGDTVGHLTDDDTFQGAVVRTLIKGEVLQTGASGGISHEGAGCSLGFSCGYDFASFKGLRIIAAYIDECATHIDATPNTIGDPKQITFYGGYTKCTVMGPEPVWSDLLDYPISPEKSYAVTFLVRDSSDLTIYPKTWRSDTNSINSYYLPRSAADPSALIDEDWSSNTNVITSAHAIGVGEIYVSYPSLGTYTSPPINTHMQKPQYESIEWDEDCPSGTQLKIEIRSAANSDMSDASDWKYISSPGIIGIDFLQYVQYRVELTSSPKGQETPKLKKIAMQWPGETSAAHLSGTFINGPDFGQFKTLIDGQELTSPLRINLEIKKEVYGMNATTETMVSETSFELTPRNSD